MPTPKKAYSFTLNNPSDAEYKSLCAVCSDECNYAILGREVGKGGTPHIQGYCLFKKSYRFSSIKNRYLPRCHIEVSAGTPDDNRRYCSKDGDFVEFGAIPETKRKRSDIALAYSKYVTGGGLDGVGEFASIYPSEYYFSGHILLRNYLALQPPRARTDLCVRWIFGVPGSGKSKKAHDTYPKAYIKDPRTKWWNGYMLEEEVIIDDFGPGGIDINHLLRWFDYYRCYVEYKGGMLPLYANKFIITSNFHPQKVFSFGGEDNPQLPALLRRIQLEEM